MSAGPAAGAAPPDPSPAGRDADPEPLPPELAALRARFAAFIAGELAPAERERGVGDEGDADGELRHWVRARAEAQGFFRLLQPADLGGGGLGPLGQVALFEQLGAANSVLARFALGGDGGVLRHAVGEQRERLLRPVLRGELAAAFAFTDAPEGPRTCAVPREGGYTLDGVKAFVTDGPAADLLLVVARVADAAGGRAGTGIFAVPRAAPGVRLVRELRTLDGGRHGVFELTAVAVAAADLVGEVGQGLPRAMESIGAVRLRIAATACGTARWVLDDLRARVRRPHRSGTPLADHEQVQALVADCAMDCYAARAATWAAARLAESGAPAVAETAMAKALATEAAGRVVDRAIQLTGGAAVVAGHPLARLYTRVRAWRIGEGTTEVLKLVIGRALLADGDPLSGDR